MRLANRGEELRIESGESRNMSGGEGGEPCLKSEKSV